MKKKIVSDSQCAYVVRILVLSAAAGYVTHAFRQQHGIGFHSRPRAYWIGNRGRRCNSSEAAHLQGVQYESWQWLLDKITFPLIGNAMPVNVLQRILVRIVRRSGMF